MTAVIPFARSCLFFASARHSSVPGTKLRLVLLLLAARFLCQHPFTLLPSGQKCHLGINPLSIEPRLKTRQPPRSPHRWSPLSLLLLLLLLLVTRTLLRLLLPRVSLLSSMVPPTLQL